MATKLRFSRGTHRSYLLRYFRPDLEPEDLTGATFAAHLKRNTLDADGDCLVDVSARVSVLDGPAGLAVLAFLPADTAALDQGESCEWEVRATLADGRILSPWSHQGPVVFFPYLGDPAIFEPPGDDIEEYTAMNILSTVFAAITGLTGGTSTDLDGLSAARLGGLPTGTFIDLFFSGSVAVRYRLRARTSALEAEVSAAAGGFVILCDHDADRCWELVSVTKEGVPCAWNPDTGLWHQQLAQGTGTAVAPALAQEAQGFDLPA